MNILSVNFRELYERHLCRHSQLGINIAHLASVLGIYLALYGLIYALTPSVWVMAILVIPYLLILAFNIPIRVFLVSVLIVGLFFWLVLALPSFPVWCYLLSIVIFHKLQSISHKFYTREKDMSQFNQKYKKGLVLFVLLSIYELPILLDYVLFGRKDWSA